MGKRKRKRAPKVQEAKAEPMAVNTPEAPAKEGPGQVLMLEPTGPQLGSAMRYRNIGAHPLDLAYGRAKLRADRYAAGRRYRDLVQAVARSNRDSTDPSPGGGSSGTPWAQVQVDAILELDRIDHELKEADLIIVRKLCGEGYSFAEALREARIPFHPNGVLPRICEALDHLGRAMLRANRKDAMEAQQWRRQRKVA